MQFNNDQLHIISNALRIAAGEFAHIALTFPHLEDAFKRQSKNATDLYNLIAEKEGIQS